MTTEKFIPFSQPSIGEEEEKSVIGVLRSGWLTSGPLTATFEKAFAEYTRASHALAVNSCSAALHLALAAMDLEPGDEVITTPLTFCATVNAILEAGGTPVLADIGDDLNIAPDAICAQITDRTRAVLPVHYAGLPCRMGEIRQLTRERNLKVIEDAAHAVGAAYHGSPVGSGLSDAVAFSFYATKNMSTGEGGMVTTSSPELYERMRVLCRRGIARDAWDRQTEPRYAEEGSWYYEVVDRGFNYHMSDVMSAIGIQQLLKLDVMNARRAGIAAAYNRAFADMPEVELPPERAGSVHAWQLYVLRLNLEMLSIDRARFFDEMRRRGIGCSVHFIPIPLHPYYRRTLQMRDPCARALAEYPRLLSLPVYPNMTDDDVLRVVEAVQDIVRLSRKRTTVPYEVALKAD